MSGSTTHTSVALPGGPQETSRWARSPAAAAATSPAASRSADTVSTRGGSGTWAPVTISVASASPYTGRKTRRSKPAPAKAAANRSRVAARTGSAPV